MTNQAGAAGPGPVTERPPRWPGRELNRTVSHPSQRPTLPPSQGWECHKGILFVRQRREAKTNSEQPRQECLSSEEASPCHILQQWCHFLVPQTDRGRVRPHGPGWWFRIGSKASPLPTHHGGVACVLSRWDDPFPLVVLEAMASGCAVIGSTRGGIPEAAGDAGVLVPDDDPAAVTGVLRRLLETPGLLRELQRRGRTHAEAMTWAMPAELLLDELDGRRRLAGPAS